MQLERPAAPRAAPVRWLREGTPHHVRTILLLWGIAFAASLVHLGVVLVLYCGGPEAGLGPCGPMGLFSAAWVAGALGTPWIPAYLGYRETRG